jgi:hypothetical protein
MRRFSLLLAFAVGCADPTAPANVPNGTWSASDTWTGQVIITENPGDPRWPSDPVTINTAEVKGDSLWMTVSFGGGCRGHTFLLLGGGPWLESYPVQTGVRLSHESNDDPCDAMLSRTLKFDLVPLKVAFGNAYGPGPGIVRINIGGFRSSVLYTW